MLVSEGLLGPSLAALISRLGLACGSPTFKKESNNYELDKIWDNVSSSK